MNQLKDRLIDLYLSVIDERLDSWTFLMSVRRGLVYMIPMILVGSFALVLLSLPIPAYHEFMAATFGDQWGGIFDYIRDGTFNVISMIMVLCISYSYAIEHKPGHNRTISPIIASTVSLGSMMAISNIRGEGFSMASFGAIGMFVAIAVAISSAMLFMRLSSIKLLQIRVFSDGASPIFSSALTAIYPAAITIAVFAIINQVLSGIFGINDIQAFVSNVSSAAFSLVRSSFWSGMLFVLLVHVFWFFGMHGSNMLEPVAQSVFVPALAANQVATSLGEVPREIFTKTFFDTFVLMGGCGAALCLIFAILIVGRYRNQRRLAELSLLPVLLNINELIVFGIPIVLNPVYLIPFVLTPLILTLSSYLAMYYRLVPLTITLVEWTTPIFLSGYASTGSIGGSILQLFNLLLGTCCYIPFVVLVEGVADKRARKKLDEVYHELQRGIEQVATSTLLARQDDIGDISRSLAVDLEGDILNNRMMLVYQPQVDHNGHIFGIEALLRWNHQSYGYIRPPLVISLAEERQLIDKLGYWIIDTACADLRRLNDEGMTALTLSVNVSALQLENDDFVSDLEKIMNRHLIVPGHVEIEITEQVALASTIKIASQINAIKELGVRLAMDDFGMGHSSLVYLKEHKFDTIKLDGSLVREILTNHTCRNIISSIVFLAKSLDFSVIAEYVEEEEQRTMLHELGCDRYQGYLFSKPVPFAQLKGSINGGHMLQEQQTRPVGSGG